LFQNYDWPGNIRELKNIVERLIIMVPSPIVTSGDIEALGIFRSSQISGAGPSSKGYDYFNRKTLKDARDAFEKDFIIKKLEENNWNISKTSEAIAIERSNLHKKIKAYDINVSPN